MKLSSKEQFDALLAGQKPVVVDFFATWCGPCKMFAPTFEAAAEKHDDIEFLKVDVDEFEDLAVSLGISYVPTIMLFKGGEKLDYFVGPKKEEDFEAFLKQAL